VFSNALQKLEIPDFDLEVKTRSGERLWVNVSTLVFEEPRRNRRLVVHLARDISRRKKSEELLAKMLEISKEMVAVSSQTQHSGGARLAAFRTRAANPSLIRAGQKLFRDRPRTGYHSAHAAESSAQHQRETPHAQSPGSRDARHAARPHLNMATLLFAPQPRAYFTRTAPSKPDSEPRPSGACGYGCGKPIP
jgi:hypothetical protein